MATESEKCRKSTIHRYGTSTAFVDVECLLNAAFVGAQWKGPDKGNQTDLTIIGLDEALVGTGGDGVAVDMTVGNGSSVSVDCKESILVSTREGGQKRMYFANTDKNGCRKEHRKRLIFNHIDESLLQNGLPPKKAKDYQEAVKKTKDKSEIYLDTYISKEVKLLRAKGNPSQAIVISNAWGSGRVGLPGSSDKTDRRRTHLRTDPFIAVINFGPDGLAVKFDSGGGALQKE